MWATESNLGSREGSVLTVSFFLYKGSKKLPPRLYPTNDRIWNEIQKLKTRFKLGQTLSHEGRSDPGPPVPRCNLSRRHRLAGLQRAWFHQRAAGPNRCWGTCSHSWRSEPRHVSALTLRQRGNRATIRAMLKSPCSCGSLTYAALPAGVHLYNRGFQHGDRG